jgi:hypothetical protein
MCGPTLLGTAGSNPAVFLVLSGREILSTDLYPDHMSPPSVMQQYNGKVDEIRLRKTKRKGNVLDWT